MTKHLPKITTILPKGIGLILSWEMVQLWPDLSLLFGPDGIIDPRLLQLQHTGLGWDIQRVLSSPLWATPVGIPLLYVITLCYILLCLAMVWGYHVRIACFILLILHQGLWVSEPGWSYGVDYLAQTGLFICCIVPYSSRTKIFSPLYPFLVLRLFQAQLAVVYVFGGMGKAIGKGWYTGEALWKAVQQPYAGALSPIPSQWGAYPLIWIIGGCMVIVIELFYPIMWAGKRYRTLGLCAIVAMHTGIALTMGLYHFAALMIWYNLCAWHYPYLPTSDSRPAVPEKSKKPKQP